MRHSTTNIALPDQFEAFVLGEVHVVLDVERVEGEFAGEAARRDPAVVDRPGPTTELCVDLDLSPDRGDSWAVREEGCRGASIAGVDGDPA
jgi:hypothetical protein